METSGQEQPVFVLISKRNSWDECPQWWRNMVSTVFPDGASDQMLNDLLEKRYGAQLMEGPGVQGSHVGFPNSAAYAQVLLEWS